VNGGIAVAVAALGYSDRRQAHAGVNAVSFLLLAISRTTGIVLTPRKR
jgi:hypothetical protein